jgi:mono/diheme cytochrome c family protein
MKRFSFNMSRLVLPVAVAAAAISLHFLAPKTTEITTATAGHQTMFVLPIDSAAKGAQIKFDEEVYDFKNIEQGTFVEHGFVIHNVGTDTLKILSTHPSCGCTAAIMEGGNDIAPGAQKTLKVKFDANNKGEGPIIKSVSISSNSKEKGEMAIRIQGTIVKSKTAHKAMAMHLDGIFAGDCAKCHVDKGKGELGARLYDADCGVCHGAKADGKPGAELASDAMMKHSPKDLKKIITQGMEGTNMPAFHSKYKGPLGDEEIASIVEYMTAFKKELERTKAMKTMNPTPSAPAAKTAGKG